MLPPLLNFSSIYIFIFVLIGREEKTYLKNVSESRYDTENMSPVILL